MEDLEQVRLACELLGIVRRAGRLAPKTLATLPGWTKPKAYRYLRVLAECGELEEVRPDGGAAKYYVIGRESARWPDLPDAR